jgi:hypothetical protein
MTQIGHSDDPPQLIWKVAAEFVAGFEDRRAPPGSAEAAA